MDTIFPNIRDWFLSRDNYFAAFAEADSRIEGWLKAEMIMLLRGLKLQEKVEDFQREFKVSNKAQQRNHVDFRIQLQGQAHLCELKALCISRATGTPRNLQFYFRENKVGIIRDLKKLEGLPSDEQKWLLNFVYPSPLPSDWETAIASIATNWKQWKCITKPLDFSESLFLALWKEEKNAA